MELKTLIVGFLFSFAGLLIPGSKLFPETGMSAYAQNNSFICHFDVGYDVVPHNDGIGTGTINCSFGKWLKPSFALAAGVGGFSNFKDHTNGPEVFLETRFKFKESGTTPFVSLLTGWAFQIPVTRIDTKGYFDNDHIALCRSRDGLSIQLKAGAAFRFGDHWFTIHLKGGLSQFYCGKWGKDPATGKTSRYGILTDYPETGEVWTKGQAVFFERFKPLIGFGLGFDI